MALITIGTYEVPDPRFDGYAVMREPVAELRDNARRVKIGEFARYRYTIEWSYTWISDTDYEGIIAAMSSSPGRYQPLVVRFYDPNTRQFQTGNFVAPPTLANVRRYTENINVRFVLVEQ